MRPTALLVALAFVVAAAPAEAATTLAPAAPIVGDGKTLVTLQLLSDDPSARFKVRADRGRVGTITPIGGGLLVEYVPPTVTEPTTVDLQIQVRGATSEDIVAKVEVVPAYAAAGFDLTFDPPVFSTEGGSVKVTPRGRTPQPDASRRLKLVASNGTVTDLVPSGGAWVARYTPPVGLKDPLQVAFSVVDLAAPSETVAAGVGAVAVSRSLTFDAAPDSNNVLKIGLREWGPVKASPTGKVAFVVEVSPATRKGQLVSVAPTGTRQVLDVDLPMTVTPAVAIATLPASAPGSGVLPVLVVCQKADGIPCAPTDLALTASAGTMSAVAAGAPGTLRAEWTLPASGSAVLTAAVGDTKATRTVNAVGGNVTISVSSNPPALPAGKKDFSVTAHVKDARGTAVVGSAPTFQAEGATASGKPKDNGDGSYTQLYKATAANATVRVSPPAAASGLAPRQVVVWTERTTAWADGASTIPVMVAVEDALGMPVAGVEVAVSVPKGDGSVAPKATTGPDGIARLAYRVGSAAGPVIIVAEGAGLKGSATLWQAPVGGAAPDIRISGGPEYVRAIERWRAAAPSLVVGPEVAAPVAAAPVAAPVAAPPPLTAAPPTMAVSAAPVVESGAAPVAGSTPKPPKAPKAPSAAGDTPWARVRGSLIDAPSSYDAELDGTADEYAPVANFSLSPFFGGFGAEAQAEAFFGGGPIGMDLRVGLLGWRAKLGDDTHTHAGIEGHAAVRYKAWESNNLAAYGSVGVARSTTVVFAYSNEEKTAAEMVDFPLLGARLAGGARMERGGLLANLELAETLAPFPVHTRLDFQLDIPLSMPGLALTLGAGLDARHAKFKVTNAEDAGVKVMQTGYDVSAGVAWMAF